MKLKITLKKSWSLLCSLKLAIVLASAATVIMIGGSLLILASPQVFGNMDAIILAKWLGSYGFRFPNLSWWVFLAGGLIILLGVNTLCCFIEWALHFRARWRKSGEYLIHLGFFLVLCAYMVGSVTGFRSSGNRIFNGQIVPLPSLPGYYLRLDDFRPRFNDAGRPIDMINTVSLLKGERVVKQQVVKINTPLIHSDLAILPQSFGSVVKGFRFFMPGKGEITLEPDTTLPISKGFSMKVHRFLPDAVKGKGGRVVSRSETLRNPAFEIELLRPDNTFWRGWYFLKEEIPSPLAKAGVSLRPTNPHYGYYSLLAINRDPGAPLALAGGAAMLAGVFIAMFSFYGKRSRGDRPQI